MYIICEDICIASIVGSLRDQEVACLASELQGFNFYFFCLEGSVIALISPSSGGSPARFSLYVHKSGLKPDSFHFASPGANVGPRLVVSIAAFHARVRGSVPGLGGLKETKNVSSPSTCESQHCGEPP